MFSMEIFKVILFILYLFISLFSILHTKMLDKDSPSLSRVYPRQLALTLARDGPRVSVEVKKSRLSRNGAFVSLDYSTLNAGNGRNKWRLGIFGLEGQKEKGREGTSFFF